MPSWKPFILLLAGSCAGAGSNPSSSPGHPELACRPGEGASVSAAEVQKGPVDTVEQGDLSERAQAAKRLFDSEKWAEAHAALEPVARGDTGDDEGSRHMAEYHLAVCAFRLDHRDEALERFARITENPRHGRFEQVLPWLARLALTPSLAERVTDLLPRFDRAAIDKFHNQQQQALWEQLTFLFGRAHYRRGERAKASLYLASLPPESDFARLAQDCQALVSQLPQR